MARRHRRRTSKPLIPGFWFLVIAGALAFVSIGIFWVLGKTTHLEVQAIPPSAASAPANKPSPSASTANR